MRKMKGVVIEGKNRLAVSEDCPLPDLDEIVPTGALIRPLIWSPCTSDAHLCATGAASLPYLVGKAIGHEMCGEITAVGPDVHDFKVGDRVIVCAVMPVWRSLEAQEGQAKQRQDNMYAGIDYPDRGGSFVETYYIRDADMNLARIPEGVSLEQAVMVPDMMCTAFEGVEALDLKFGQSVAVIGIGPVGLMAVRACVLHGASRVYAVGSRKICFAAAAEYGATKCVDYHDEDYLQQIIEDNGGKVDRVMICGGNEDSLSQGLSILKNGGTLVNLSAYFSGKPIGIDPAAWGFGYGDKTIKGVGCGGGRALLERMAALIEQGRVQPEKMITHRFYGLEEIPRAMDLFLNHDRSLIKPVIYNTEKQG
jgi:threonine dehydrogenase-like Zn-dependent dehydrogenase